MKTASVSHLKAHLSEYLAGVRRGGTVVVLDRKTPIAQLVPYLGDEADDLCIENAVRPGDLKNVRGVQLRRPIDAVARLREDREQR